MRRERCFEISNGKQRVSRLSSVSEEKVNTVKTRVGLNGQGIMHVCKWGWGATGPISKKLFFYFGVQSFIIYTYEYIENTEQCVNLYISITYRIIMEGETDSLSLIQEERLLVLVTNTSAALLCADITQKPRETKTQAAQLSGCSATLRPRC